RPLRATSTYPSPGQGGSSAAPESEYIPFAVVEKHILFPHLFSDTPKLMGGYTFRPFGTRFMFQQLFKFNEQVFYCNRFAIFNMDVFNYTCKRCLNYCFHFHCFRNNQIISLFYLVTFLTNNFNNSTRHSCSNMFVIVWICFRLCY